MKKLIAPAVALAASLAISAATLAAGPTTAPASVIDAIKTENWSVIPQKLKLQYASTAVEPDQVAVTNWTGEYSKHFEQFKADRQKALDNAWRDTKILFDGKYVDLAMDGLADCYTLSLDKQKFAADPWVVSLRNEAVKSANESAKAGDWLKARRIYSNLSVLEPTDSKWTKSMEEMVRRIRLLTRYAPESIAGTLQKEAEYRRGARKYLTATTRPSTEPPATQPVAEDKNETEAQIAANLKTDWQQELGGVRGKMLRDALTDARQNYYKDTSAAQMLTGGLTALRTFATTPGLEKTFTNLADEKRRTDFISVIDRTIKSIADQPADRVAVEAVLNLINVANVQTIGLPEQVMINEFADGAFATLDPFSSMIWPSDMDEFRTNTQGEFSGVGVQIQEFDGMIKVVTPLEDSPALKAGIRAGDVITSIAGKSAKGITTLQAKKQITGPSGTPVVLTVRSPDDKVKEYTLTRQTIKVASIKGWRHLPGGGWDYMLDEQQKIGYMRLTNFTKESSRELSDAVERMEDDGARAIILDLRSNPGGLLTAATEIADKFLAEGKIVSTQSLRDETTEARIEAHSTRDDVKLPMVVLVNQYSASASEIVSGALKDLKRATIIGERTFGKGSVQMLFPLDGQQALLKLTTSHYYLPNGKCIHREENAAEWGVDPDLTVEITPEQMRRIIDARSELDVLRDSAMESEHQAKVQKELIDSDLQLSASLFILRLQLAGTPAM